MNNKFQVLKHRFDNLEHEKGSETAQLTEQLQGKLDTHGIASPESYPTGLGSPRGSR